MRSQVFIKLRLESIQCWAFYHICWDLVPVVYYSTGEEVSIDKQVACEECPRWLKMTEVACEKTEVAVC